MYSTFPGITCFVIILSTKYLDVLQMVLRWNIYYTNLLEMIPYLGGRHE